jgi:DNA-binding CsgD family transcriptional regulator
VRVPPWTAVHDVRDRGRAGGRRRRGGQRRANAEIAAELHMSVATVKAHVSRLLAKLEVENRVQIALLVQTSKAYN